jgi:hypothetical protein
MKLTAAQIRDMADYLEAGMKIFINCETLEYRWILDWDDITYPEPWDEEMEKIDSEWNDFVVLEKMDSSEAFRVMEDFADEVEDKIFRDRLSMVLKMRSPFANFKHTVEASPLKEAWYAFKRKRYEAYTRKFLRWNEIEFEE